MAQHEGVNQAKRRRNADTTKQGGQFNPTCKRL
jgi:hypothetical protein